MKELLLVVEWFYFSGRWLLIKELTLANFFPLIFVCKMCVLFHFQ